MSEPANVPAVIASGASLSGAIDVREKTLVGLLTPAAWTAAALSFQVNADGSTTYVPLFNSAGNEVTLASASIPTNAARAFALAPDDFFPWRYLKVQSGVNGSGVNQGAERTVTLVFRGMED